MKQCKCGGLVTEHALSGERTALSCRACGRCEVAPNKCLEAPRQPAMPQAAQAAQFSTEASL